MWFVTVNKQYFCTYAVYMKYVALYERVQGDVSKQHDTLF